MNDGKRLIISVEAVKNLLGQQRCVFVDARGGPDAYDRFNAGHLPGAVFVDLETDLSMKSGDAARGGRHPLPDPSTFGALLGKVGITPADHLIVYDDKAGANAAARFWWMMKAAGHDKVQVVDGGLSILNKAHLPMSKGPQAPLPMQKPYPITEWLLPTADMEQVDRLRLQKEFVIIDVRENYRYEGASEPIDLVAGHIPGAVNVSYLNNLDSDGTFSSPESLANQYKAIVGNREADKIIVHCGSGVTACHTLLALEIAGIHRANLYVGSWSEWSRNNKPIATGQMP
jgi:thiosulfate/3-mercaptopyruvate sulfurtransferase